MIKLKKKSPVILDADNFQISEVDGHHILILDEDELGLKLGYPDLRIVIKHRQGETLKERFLASIKNAN